MNNGQNYKMHHNKLNCLIRVAPRQYYQDLIIKQK